MEDFPAGAGEEEGGGVIRLRRRSLVDLLADAIARDPGDAPAVYLEADIMADDMQRYAPTAEDPMEDRAQPVRPI